MTRNSSKIFFLLFFLSYYLSAQTTPSLQNVYDTADINTPVNVNAPGVLVNDTDIDGDTLTVTGFSVNGTNYLAGETATFSQGEIIINTDGSYTFTPITNYTGTVSSITYTVSDGTFTNAASLLFTVEEVTNLLDIEVFESCNQGYTVNEEYKIIYYATIQNTSNARDYHESSLITNIDVTDNLDAVFGTGCVSSVEVYNVSTSITTDYISDPYPQEFNEDAINPNFLDATSSSIFSNDAINNLTLYPRQSITIQFCVTFDAFCGGRANPTASGSGIDFNNTLSVISSTDTNSNTLSLSDFHSSEAIVTGSLYVPENSPTVNLDGTFDYTNTVIITNEGSATAENINYNMGLGNFLDNGISFSQLIVSKVSGPTININTSFDGNINTELLTTNNSLASGETIILEIYALTDPLSSSNSNNFSQISRSQTQGILDDFDESISANKRVYSFVNWSDTLGNHLDRYYPTNSATSAISSTSQCSCTTSSMSFSYTSSTSTSKIISTINDNPNDILEHQELTFQITVTNRSNAIQIENLQLQDDLNAICSGNIIAVSTPIIESSTANTNPTLNAFYNGITDINIFDGTSGVLEPNETITIEYSVLFNEDCEGTNTAVFTAVDPLNNASNSSGSVPIDATTDNDDDGIPNGTDIDDDNDTIPDTDEYNGLNPLEDHDGDFIPNYRDLDFNIDTNNDGIVDLFDFDNDGIPNHFDLDSDNDGIFDLVEVNNSDTSADSDGIASTTNVGSNGLHNDVENSDTSNTTINYTIPNTDNDTDKPNFIDIDADNDGIVDTIEAQTTTDYLAPNDMISDYGIDTAYPEGINPIDSDEDGVFDYVDINSDSDIRDDYIEGWDIDSDGTPETIASNSDSDNDGLDDAYDNDDSIINPTNEQVPTDFPDVDNTDDPERDWRERMAIVLLINDVTNNEGEDITFTISLVTKNDNTIPVQSIFDIMIDFSTVDGTDTTSEYTIAVNPYDYTAIVNGILTIPAYDDIATFTVNSLDDIIYERDELFTLNGTVTSNNTYTTAISGIGTVINNDNPPSIAMNNSEADEGDALEHIITLSHPSSLPITIGIATSDIIATNPNDYSELISNLTIAGTTDPNNANTETSFSITTLTDNTNELDAETLNVTGIISSDLADIGTVDLTKTGTILDIDPDPLIEITEAIAVEGETLDFTFTLVNADLEPMFNYLPINFNLETFDETTIADQDYTSVNTTGSIPAYTSSIIQSVSTIDDNLNEDTETLILQTTITAVVSNNSPIIETIGTIKDNDIPNLFSPNGDGKSDTFKIAGIDEFPNFKLVIFDRWGSEVYNYNNNGNTNPTWWDGYLNGKPVPEGVYFYTLDFNDNETQPKKNFIQLIR